MVSPIRAGPGGLPGHDELQREATPGDGAAVGGAGVAAGPGIERHLDVGREHCGQHGETGRAGPARAPDQADGADELGQAAGVNEVGVVLLGDGARHEGGEDLRADQVHDAAGGEGGGKDEGGATPEADHGWDCTVAACQPK